MKLIDTNPPGRTDAEGFIYGGEDFPVLLFKLKGYYGIGSDGNSDAHHLHKKMQSIRQYAEDFSGVIIDMRELFYEWGDQMSYLISDFGCGVRPVILISDLCREGMSSFVECEMFSDVSEYLRESLEEGMELLKKNLSWKQEVERFMEIKDLNDADRLKLQMDWDEKLKTDRNARFRREVLDMATRSSYRLTNKYFLTREIFIQESRYALLEEHFSAYHYLKLVQYVLTEEGKAGLDFIAAQVKNASSVLKEILAERQVSRPMLPMMMIDALKEEVNKKWREGREIEIKELLLMLLERMAGH